MPLRFITIALLLAVYCLPCYAAPSGAVLIGQDGVTNSEYNGKVYTCAQVNSSWTAGTQWKKDNDYFVPHQAKIKSLKKKLKKKSGSAASRIRTKIKNLKKLKKLGQKACTPADSPPPSLGGCNFDAYGNVTAKGKLTFGIPSGLSADLNTGMQVYQSSCVGCHEEKTDRTFSNLRTNIARDPMYYTQSSMPDSSLAHLTAYFNRFSVCD